MNTQQTFIDAAQKGDLQLVEQMVAHEPSLVNAKSPDGLSAVLNAIYYGQRHVAESLIAHGADLNVFEAEAAGKLDRVKELMDEQPSLANAYADDGFQPLGLASFLGHKAIVDFLLSRGAEVNSASRNNLKVMPLHSAVASQNIDIARKLLEHGADVNAIQADDFTPLHGAAQNGQTEMVRLLLTSGANREARSADGQTALSLAQAKGYQEAADLLQLTEERRGM